MLNVSKIRALAETLAPLLEIAESAEALNKADAEVKAARLNATLANAQAKASKEEVDLAREDLKNLKAEISNAKQEAEKFVADLIAKSTKATKDAAESLITDAEDRGRKIVNSAKTEHAKILEEIKNLMANKDDIEKSVKAETIKLGELRQAIAKITGG